MGKKTKNDELTPEEVEEQNAEELPERSAMTVLTPPHIYPSPPIPDDDGLLGGGPPDPTNV